MNNSDTGEVVETEIDAANVPEKVGEQLILSTGNSGMAKTIGKLDDEAYRPWGTSSNQGSNPASRSNSDTGSESGSKEICKGGPGKDVCGERVTEGVMCDKCGFWFHALCQQIPKPAVTALRRYKKLAWLCEGCRAELSVGLQSGSAEREVGKELKVLNQTLIEHIKLMEQAPKTQVDLKALEAKVGKLELSIQNHVKLVENSMREQERSAEDQLKVLKRTFENQNTQKASYADMLKSACTNVVKEVNSKLSEMPVISAQRNEAKTAHDMSCMLDSYLDKDRRKLNVVVHNLKEEPGETLTERSAKDQAAFQTVVKEGLKLNVRTVKSFRVGKKIPEKPRLLIVTIETLESKLDLLSKVSQLKDTRWQNIYINPDLTKQEREEGKKLRAELKSRREAGETNLTIRHGKVVQLATRDPKTLYQAQGTHTRPRNVHEDQGAPGSQEENRAARNNIPAEVPKRD